VSGISANPDEQLAETGTFIVHRTPTGHPILAMWTRAGSCQPDFMATRRPQKPPHFTTLSSFPAARA